MRRIVGKKNRHSDEEVTKVRGTRQMEGRDCSVNCEQKRGGRIGNEDDGRVVFLELLYGLV